MATLLHTQNLCYSVGSKVLFDDLSLQIHSNDRIALVGHNGCGKSSLFALLSNQQLPDKGEITRTRGLKISLVEQFVPEHILHQQVLASLLTVLEPEQRSYQQYRAETLLQQLGFQTEQLYQSLENLSGGQKNLVLFARAVISDPELLLMDEPGNHMDIVSLTRLTDYLQAQKHLSFVMVSHDRDLLDQCCNKTIFLRDRRSYSFDLPFSMAKEQLQQMDEAARHKRTAEEREINRIRASAKRLAQWGRDFDNEDLSRKAISMERRVERLQQDLTNVSQGSGLYLNLDAEQVNVKTMLILEQMQVRHADDLPILVSCEYLVIRPGDRIALLGRNGVGKSSTLNTWMEQYRQTQAETVRFNPGVKLFYYDQELSQFNQESRFDWLRKRVEGADDQIRQTLIAAGIAYQDIHQPSDQLSGGEKARMMFMLMQLQKPNFIILDEPTNHIDLEGREQLEQQLIQSGATLLITSHDRHFLQQVANRYWLIEANILKEIHDPELFYQSLHQTIEPDNTPMPSNKLKSEQIQMNEEEILEEIDRLETLLRQDQQRKAKFQKPQKQQQWQHQLEQLWQQLEQ